MTDWQLTATTIYCDAIQNEVTIFVYRDGSLGCTGFNQNNQESNQRMGVKPADSANTVLKKGCIGLECENTTGYRDRLFSEENRQNG